MNPQLDIANLNNRKSYVSIAEHRRRSRSFESRIVDHLMVSCMLAGVVAAFVVLLVAAGCYVGIFAF